MRVSTCSPGSQTRGTRRICISFRNATHIRSGRTTPYNFTFVYVKTQSSNEQMTLAEIGVMSPSSQECLQQTRWSPFALIAVIRFLLAY